MLLRNVQIWALFTASSRQIWLN